MQDQEAIVYQANQAFRTWTEVTGSWSPVLKESKSNTDFKPMSLIVIGV